MINSAFDIPGGSRVAPKDGVTARVLGRGRFIPTEGTVMGHAGRGGEYCLVKWDNHPGCFDETTHWANLKVLA